MEAAKKSTVEIQATSTGGNVFGDVVMMDQKLYQFNSGKKANTEIVTRNKQF